MVNNKSIINWIKGLSGSFKLKRCGSCSKYVGILSFLKSRNIGGIVYCKDCAHFNFRICECCDNIVDRLRSVDGKKICSSCFINKTRTCESCGQRKMSSDLITYGYRDVCSSCYLKINRSFRSINIGQKKQESETFIKNPDKRYCGLEIECLNRHRDANCFIKDELKDFRFSQGKDASLDAGGVEFRSVPMNGDLLFDSIEKFVKELNIKRYRANKSCGLHIHLEITEDVEFLKKLYLFYLRFEDMFFNMLPKSRRSSDYCERFSKHYRDTTEQIMAVKDLNKFKQMIYETKYYKSEVRSHANSKRYCWANLHSIFYRGTLEIRNHSGTVNYSKIINWIMIHQRVLDFLNKTSLEEIGKMNVTKKNFLNIFSKPLQDYIKRRWKVFINLEEKDLKTRMPVYIKEIKNKNNGEIYNV